MQKELLQDLANLTGCTYISDLRFLPEPDIIKVFLEMIVPCEYSIADWNLAVHYLTNNRVEFLSVEEAKKYLIDYKFPRL